MWVDFDVRDNRRWTFSLEEAFAQMCRPAPSSRVHSGVLVLATSDNLKLKTSWWICFLQTQLLSSQDINWWIGVVWITCGLLWCFYQLFRLSFWRHPFTAEDPLVIHSDAMLHFSKSVEETNSFTSWMAWGCLVFLFVCLFVFKANFHFWVHCSFKYKQ